MSFTLSHPDHRLSPYTGMTRQHWLAAARFLLEGVLRHVTDVEAPIPMPGTPPEVVNLEALARTFMIAAPLVAADPEAEVAGIRVREFYAHQVRSALDEQSPYFIGHFEATRQARGREVLGHTVEGAALALGLWWAGPQIWGRYTPAECDRIAGWFSEVAHGRTNTHNWRWFNVIMAAFLRTQGYAADEAIVLDHLQHLLAYYAGDGWYRDGAHFDFYSAWAFQFYGPIWCRQFGEAAMPEAAALVARNHLALQRTYPMLFGRDGAMPMWGRSIIYRFGATAPLSASFLLREQAVSPGWARRIASGCLQQFLCRDDVFTEGRPTLGFYRAFPPVVQGYSQAASPYWLAKAFVALTLPEDGPFWTAPEEEGDWATLGAGARTAVLAGPGMTLTIHGPTGAAELRPGKAAMKSSLLYTRLVYNTAFPGEDDNPDGATTATYAVKQLAADGPFRPADALRFVGERDGVLYRQQDLPAWMSRVDLAEIILPGGVLRVDRLAVPYAHEVRLGHFALPHREGQAPTLRAGEAEGRQYLTAHGADGRALALVAYAGWDGLAAETHAGLGPETDVSTVPYAVRRRTRDHAGMPLLVTLLLHRTDGGTWTPEELDPVAEMTFLPWAPSGSPCGVRLRLRDGREFLVDFGPIAGQVMA